MERKNRGPAGKRRGLLRGALVLTAGMAAVKVLGALFKVPLTYALGEYGVGLFHMAYHFYGPLLSLATVGFPVAVSRLVSENSSLGRWNDARQVKGVAMPLFLALGSAGMGAMTLLAPLYCRWVPGAAYALAPMLTLAPAVLFACASSVYRGYYEGLGNMAPTAASQVLEALMKLGLGLLAAKAAVAWGEGRCRQGGSIWGIVPAGEDQARFLVCSLGAAAAVLGVTAGSLVSFAYLGLRFRLHGDGTPPRLYRESPRARGRRETRRALLAAAAPVALASVVSNVAGLLDATLLQSRVGALVKDSPQEFFALCGFSLPAVYRENPAAVPTYLYGCYTLAMTVYLLVPGVTQALGVSALPAVTGAWARKNRRELREKMGAVVRAGALFAFPAGLGMAALAGPLARLLYGEGPSTPVVARCLELLGLAALASAMSGPLSSMLQAVGRADLPVKLLLGAMALKLGASWALSGVPQIHIYGAPLSTLLSYAFLTVSQFWCLKKATGVRLSGVGLLFRPLACGTLCGACARLAWDWTAPLVPGGKLGEALGVLAGAACGGAVYLVSLLILRGIGKNDLLFLPGGQKIAKTLEKQGWM